MVAHSASAPETTACPAAFPSGTAGPGTTHDANAPSRFWFFFLAALLAAIPKAILIFYIDAWGANAELASATCSRGVLHAAIAYRAPHAGVGQQSYLSGGRAAIPARTLRPR